MNTDQLKGLKGLKDLSIETLSKLKLNRITKGSATVIFNYDIAIYFYADGCNIYNITLKEYVSYYCSVMQNTKIFTPISKYCHAHNVNCVINGNAIKSSNPAFIKDIAGMAIDLCVGFEYESDCITFK